MILSEITSGKEMILGGASIRTASRIIRLPIKEEVICLCKFVPFSCDYKELAFYDVDNPTDEYKNDFKSVLLDLPFSTSTYSFILVKASDESETPLIDDTYGQFYGQGFNATHPLKVGYRIDWLKVFEELGAGLYSIKVVQETFDVELITTSHYYKVMKFSELASQGTVKIKNIQNGVTLNNGDYTDMEWTDMIRLYAKFGNEQQQNEITRLKNGDYKDYDVQTDFHYQYTLKTNLIPSQIADYILNSDIKTDEVYISNYDIYAYRQYRDLSVLSTGDVEASDDYTTNTNKHFTITFEDRQKNIKRNFK